MKKLCGILVSISLALSMCITGFAMEPTEVSEEQDVLQVSTASVEEILNNDYWTVLSDETGLTPIPMELEERAGVDYMYTRVVVGYNRPDKRLAVGITNYVPNGGYLFYSMTGTITVVDEESEEIIISNRPFSASNLIPDTSIDTTESIENIGLVKGEKIAVTASGNCAVSADAKIVSFTQTAHCTVSV